MTHIAPEDLARNDSTAAALARALGTQYQVLRILGRGGMGVVYLAREPFLERDVAVKVLPAEMASGAARERFLREARTAARLSHPNIVPLFTFGEADDLLYYVMGFVDGESLEARLRRDGRLPADDTRRIVKELSDALDYAHQLGVVHRDIKPDNVLLDRATGRAMLTDFGVAKQRAGLETLTQTGVLVGTPHYMSPEQGSGDRDLDGRSDIYSLGVMAYRMATGRLPFEGDSLREVLVQHATQVPLAPSRIVQDLPLDLDTVITRALAKDPAERWPSAGAVREALTPESDESIPDELRETADVGVNLGLMGLGLLELAFMGGVFGFLTRPEAVGVAGCGVLLPAAAVLSAWRPARRFGWSAALRSSFRQPTWWRSWWPRRLRRHGDVWDRLPAQLRAVRRINVFVFPFAIVFANLILFVMRESFIAEHPDLHRAIGQWGAWATAAVLFAAIGRLIARQRRWQKPLALSKRDQGRLLQEPTFGSSFWSRPHIASLLTAPVGMPPSLHSSPLEILQEIAALAKDESRGPNATLSDEARNAAQLICSAIHHADDELAQLLRDADPRERSRIQESMKALGEQTNTESSAKAQMRELLDRQLALFQELESRRTILSGQRQHLLEQLRTLALHLAQLRAARLSSIDNPGATTTIENICRDIQYRVQGAAEVRTLLSS